jgi:hypothetical protein
VFWSFQNIPQALGSIWVNFGKFPKTLVKNKLTSNLTVCVQRVTKYQKCEIKWDKYFVNEVETQLRGKPLQGGQTQEIHYQKTKLVQRQ